MSQRDGEKCEVKSEAGISKVNFSLDPSKIFEAIFCYYFAT